ncbi:hypothetical protein OS493_017740 [Desmophyllum pertusum]|uniref:EGF-like domain-containing protein n=1 Tax=Desmophyllum pertusum TaxID=174260 RepID=A0A9W9ZCL5_9CNID|nr:hypothetical protein OS493_017740 [Desmophyllum pertusum]
MTCELLPKDLYNAPLKFRKSKNSHHWNIITPCLHFPCANGGTCVPDYNRGLYDCLCPIGYQGMNCQLLSSSRALGRDISNPGYSCKDIADRQDHPQGDGEYWIAPVGSIKPFTVYCDMTTDGSKIVAIIFEFRLCHIQGIIFRYLLL